MIALGSALRQSPALTSSVAMQSVVACFPRDVGFPEACFKVDSPRNRCTTSVQLAVVPAHLLGGPCCLHCQQIFTYIGC